MNIIHKAICEMGNIHILDMCCRYATLNCCFVLYAFDRGKIYYIVGDVGCIVYVYVLWMVLYLLHNFNICSIYAMDAFI